jgi:hypothetical protein
MSCMHVRAAQESSCDTETYNKYMAKEQQNWIQFIWIEF